MTTDGADPFLTLMKRRRNRETVIHVPAPVSEPTTIIQTADTSHLVEALQNLSTLGEFISRRVTQLDERLTKVEATIAGIGSIKTKRS